MLAGLHGVWESAAARLPGARGFTGWEGGEGVKGASQFRWEAGVHRLAPAKSAKCATRPGDDVSTGSFGTIDILSYLSHCVLPSSIM